MKVRGRLAPPALAALLAALLAVPPAAAEPPAPAEAPYRILVTNDDGIDAPGLAALVEALAPLGELTIVAPLDNHSGVGHALVLRQPVFVLRRQVAGRPATALSGTPATCVRVATDRVMKGAPPHLVVSGINRGLNFGRNAYISGTVAAAREAALQGLPAIAVSLARAAHPDYGAAAAAAAEIAAVVKEHGLPDGVFLNVNVPASVTGGLKPARQSRLAGAETFEEHRNPYGRPYLWSFFRQPEAEAEPGSDVDAVRGGHVAVTPLKASEADDEALAALSRLLEDGPPATPAPRQR